jgi:hypothetical protein
MAERFEEQVEILDKAGRPAIVLNAEHASFRTQREGRRTVIDEDLVHVGQRVALETPPATPSNTARLVVGDRFRAGIAAVRDTEGKPVFTVDGSERRIRCLAQLIVLDDKGGEVLRFEPSSATLRLGGTGGTDGDVEVRNGEGKVTIHLDGATGDIKLMGADCAEVFAARDLAALEPGSVCVIGLDGALEPCRDPYDSRVAGIVAGAGDLRPGIVLGQGTAGHHKVPLSLTGRVWCKVDADLGEIRPGDLLTTSGSAGHAMRADDVSRRPGAIVGKALAPLAEGRGFVPVLVGLQ